MNPDGMTIPNHIEVKLECGHALWFQREMLPKPGDSLFCRKCNDYADVFPSHAHMGTMYMDTWKSEPRRTKFLGTCLHEDCDPFIDIHRNWHRLEEIMHVHYMRTHTRFGARLTIEVIDRLPPNSHPPF